MIYLLGERGAIMTKLADELLSAIEASDLDATLATELDRFAVVILHDGKELFRVGCLHIERPKAVVADDACSVDVFPSSGLPDGFSIPCADHEEAIIIAESLEGWFWGTYEDLVNPDR